MLRLTLFIALLSAPVLAGAPEVVGVAATPSGDSWRLDVTVLHEDTGWDHYADGWTVMTPEGEELGYRKLLHPHETEQPFTRSLGGVTIPDGVTEVHVIANDSVHGRGARFVVPLPGR